MTFGRRPRRESVPTLLACGVLLTAVPAAAQDTAGTGPVRISRDARKLSVTGFPYVFSTPEAGVAFGIGGIVTFYTSRDDPELRPSKVSASGWYSLNDQYKLSLTPQVFFNQNRFQVGLPVDYGRFTDRYWGTGNQSEEFPSDTSPGEPNERFRRSSLNVKLDIQFPATFFGATRSGIAVEYNDTRILDTLTNPLFDSTLTGIQGGQTLGTGFLMLWDTRNQTFFPSGGGLYVGKLLFFPLFATADFQYSRLEVDLRHYLGRSADEVLALQAYGSFVFGGAPFYALSALGGASRMRGYFEGRYRDRHMVAVQAEYRRMVWWRLGFAAFAGVGDVFGSDASDLSIRNLKWSLGGGLRLAFNRTERVNLRVDFGFGRHTSGVYFQLEEAF